MRCKLHAQKYLVIPEAECVEEIDMPTFELNTEFSDEDLSRLYITGTNIVVAKPTPGGGTPNVAWIVYRPMAKNKMTWEEQYVWD